MSSTSASASRPAPSAQPRPGTDALGGFGALSSLIGYVAVFYWLIDDSLIDWAPLIAALGAAGVIASGLAWRGGSRSLKTTLGVGSAWLPFLAGVILSIVSIAS